MEFEKGKEADFSLDKLDVEYRQILRIIKPYIQTINNNTYLAQYRVWLEKLSEASDKEKFVRNQYLMELATQIQCKHLASPFTQTPPTGILPPLRAHKWNFQEPPYESYDQPLDVSESFLNKQRMCQQWAEDNESNLVLNKPQWPYHTASPRTRRSSPNQQLLTTDQQLREAQRCVKRSATSVKKINLLKEIDEQVGTISSSPSRSPTRPIRSPPTPSPPPPTPKELKLEFEGKKRQPYTSQSPSLGVIHEDNPDLNQEVSWCDLTETSNVSLAVMGSGDTEGKEEKKKVNQQGEQFEKKINTLMIEINGLKRKSEKMNERCDNTIRTVQEQMPQNSQVSVEDVKDTGEHKNVTEKDSSYMTTDWKKIVESLQVRLSETQHQNKELNGLTSTLHKKIKEMDHSKEQMKQEMKKQIMEQHKKELETLKAHNAKMMKEMEARSEKKLTEVEEKYEKQNNEMEKKYESNIKDVEDKYRRELKEKDDEIGRLEDIIQKECSRLVNEITLLRAQIEQASQTNTSNDERILFLQKCITKMDRLFQKSEREYCKQIEKLKQDLDNRDKAIQIQLQTQKAEVITRCSAEKQSEMDIIVQNLEGKYTHLLEMQRTQMAHIKDEDEKVINELRSILEEHNIPY